MFRKLATIYREFAIDGRRADEVVEELIRLSEQLGILEGKLERAVLKAFGSGKMLDVEIAKEIFHSRVREIDSSRLGGVDPAHIFKGISCRPH